jgi:hypothetical protein
MIFMLYKETRNNEVMNIESFSLGEIYKFIEVPGHIFAN